MKIHDVIVEQNIDLNDSFDIELGNLIIETGVVGLLKDGVVLEADEKTLALLKLSGASFESVDSKVITEARWGRRSSFYNPLDQERREQDQMDYEKRAFKRAELQHELGHEDHPDFERRLKERDRGPWYLKINGKIMKVGGVPKVFDWRRGANNYALAILKNRPELEGKIFLTKKNEDDAVSEGRMAEVDMIFRDLASGNLDIYDVMNHPQGAEEKYVSEKLQDMYDAVSIDHRLHPDDDFEEIINIVAQQLADEYGTDDMDQQDLSEAKYQGREVALGKPMAGDVKKSKVYVRGPKGNVVKVNFGDKKMRIKKSNPKRRKSFRARHNCANPGPRWKARYWSCRAW